MNLISNDSLKKSIVDCYAFINIEFNPKINKYRDAIDHASRNIFNTRFDTFWNLGEGIMITNDYESLKKDVEYNYFIKSLDNQIFWMVEDPLTQVAKQTHLSILLIKN